LSSDPASAPESSGATHRRLARNTVYSAVGELSNLLIFLLGFLAARYLAPEAFGDYRAAYAFVGLFRLLPDLGMSYASTIEISRDRGRAGRLIGNLLGFQAVLSFLTLGACLTLGAWIYRNDETTWPAIAILGVDLVLKSVKNTLRWLLKGFEAFGAEAVSLTAERALLLAAGLAVLASGGGVIGFVLVFLAVRLPDLVALLGYVHLRVQPLRVQWDYALWWELARKGLPFAYAGAVILAFFQIDVVMIERIRGTAEAGLYGLPTLVLEGLTLVPRILGYALIPTMAALHARSPEGITDLYRRGVRYLLLVGLPIAAFGALAAEPFMILLGGPEYATSAVAAWWLIPSGAIMFLSNFGETTLYCVNRRGTIVVVSTIALAANVVLNLLWIPRFGFEGAAWATVITEGSYFAMTAAALHRYGHRISWLSVAIRPLLPAGVFSFTLWLTLGPLPLLAAAAAASTAWVAATFTFRVWTQGEWEVAREWARRLRR
jgi:O-antigen/teichoic acid export membrane protein